uniref:Uncharacterized protein n=1 Tax=Pararge aegeria TaxID=116150 RepID=S4P2W7_9NEOP
MCRNVHLDVILLNTRASRGVLFMCPYHYCVQHNLSIKSTYICVLFIEPLKIPNTLIVWVQIIMICKLVGVDLWWNHTCDTPLYNF